MAMEYYRADSIGEAFAYMRLDNFSPDHFRALAQKFIKMRDNFRSSDPCPPGYYRSTYSADPALYKQWFDLSWSKEESSTRRDTFHRIAAAEGLREPRRTALRNKSSPLAEVENKSAALKLALATLWLRLLWILVPLPLILDPRLPTLLSLPGSNVPWKVESRIVTRKLDPLLVIPIDDLELKRLQTPRNSSAFVASTTISMTERNGNAKLVVDAAGKNKKKKTKQGSRARARSVVAEWKRGSIVMYVPILRVL